LNSNQADDRFTGKPVSQTTGLYYDYSRWYDPSVGRFISADPFPGHKADPQSLNRYVYAVDNPSTNTDPTGLDCFSSLSSFGNCAGHLVYDNTVGAAVNSYNWYQGASDSDRRAFWLGVGVAVGIGVVIGASCVVAACAGLALLGMGGLAGVTGSVWAGATYRLAGGQSEGGLKASLFWGGLGAGAGFGLGAWGANALSSQGDSLFSETSFETAAKLQTHFDDHGISMGYNSPAEYLSGARSLLERGYSGEAELYMRGSVNPDVIAVEPGTGTFTVYNPGGNFFRTFFTHPGGYDWIVSQIRDQGWVPFPLD